MYYCPRCKVEYDTFRDALICGGKHGEKEDTSDNYCEINWDEVVGE